MKVKETEVDEKVKRGQVTKSFTPGIWGLDLSGPHGRVVVGNLKPRVSHPGPQTYKVFTDQTPGRGQRVFRDPFRLQTTQPSRNPHRFRGSGSRKSRVPVSGVVRSSRVLHRLPEPSRQLGLTVQYTGCGSHYTPLPLDTTSHPLRLGPLLARHSRPLPHRTTDRFRTTDYTGKVARPP